MKISLLQPQIAPNTGNIGRLCVATGTELHIVRPMGFVLDDKQIRRSGMDYWDRLKLTVHDDTESFFRSLDGTRFWLFTSKSDRSFWDADYSADDCLIFGSETAGISEAILSKYPNRTLRVPQAPDERCLNLSTAAGIALYEALRKITRPTTA